MSRVFAYCRVSTTDQTTDNQIREIKAAGFAIEERRITTESISGSMPSMERPEFAKLHGKLEREDVLVVTKLDRLGRNAMDIRATVEQLADIGVRVHCLALGGVDLTSTAGKMTMGVLAAVAEFERDLLIERTQAGISRARSEGKKFGRPSTFTTEQEANILDRIRIGETIAGIAADFKTSRQTIMRVRDKVASLPS